MSRWIQFLTVIPVAFVVACGGAEDPGALGVAVSPVPEEIPPKEAPKPVVRDPVDYAKLHNDHFGQGVTPDTNAAAFIVRALGPETIPQRQRTAVLKALGVGELPADGPYLVSQLPDDERDADQRMDEDIAASSRPWKREEFPAIVKWLELNKEPLRVLELASRCEHYFVPIPSDPAESITLSIYIGGSGLRSAAYGFAWRAMLHAGEGRLSEAWSDLMVIERLASLLNRGSDTVDTLLALGIQLTAHRAQVGLFQNVPITRQASIAIRRELDAFHHADVNEIFDRTERYQAMQWFDILQTGELGELEPFYQNVDVDLIPRLARNGHFDEQLRERVDHHLDEMVRAARLPTFRQQKRAFEQIDEHYEARVGSSFLEPEIFLDRLDEAADDAERAELIVDRMLELIHTGNSVYAQSQCTCRTYRQLLHGAVALAAYHHDHDGYPAALDDLVPNYLAKAPIDPYSLKPLRYASRHGGYVLWSIGRNGKNDQGDDVDGDDLVVKDDRVYNARRREVIADWLKRGARFLVIGDEADDAALEHPDEVFSADFWNCENFTDEDMKMVATLGYVSFLTLNNSEITDAGLVHLKELPRLSRLSLSNTRVTDAGMEHLVGLTTLRDISVRETAVTEAGVTRLQSAIPGVEVRR